jgi:hypothetical protein
MGYVVSTGRNLFLRSITNLITGATTTTGVGTAIHQFGGHFAEIDYKTSGGTEMYNSLQSSIQRRFARGLSLGAQYTWAKELGTSSGSNQATTAQNPYDFKTEYGRESSDSALAPRQLLTVTREAGTTIVPASLVMVPRNRRRRSCLSGLFALTSQG